MSFPKSFERQFQQSHSWSSEDKKESLDEEDDMSVLDSKILDADPPQFSVSTDIRSISASQFHRMDSSDGNMWTHPPQQQTHAALPHQLQGQLPLATNSSDKTPDLSHQQSFYMNTNGPWSTMNTSGACTPTPTYTPVQQEFDESAASQSRPPTTNVFNQQPFQVTPNFSLPASIPMSPQSSQGWMSTASSDAAEAQSRALRSPTLQPSSPLSMQRRDGVRKKNARFDIPKERNLENIDSLIKLYSERGDDAQLKELKQQKRLLRNRQAALDSRQRKKLHTEALEREKAQTEQYIKELHDEIESYKASHAAAMQYQASLEEQQRQMQNIHLSLRMEMEDIIRTSTVEAGDLRRQNNILRDHCQRMEQELLASQNNSHMNDFTHFDSLPMDGVADWADYGANPTNKMASDHVMPMEPQATFSQDPAPVARPEQSTALSKSEYPFSWNTFYLCLLFGAFIVSNTTTSTSSGSGSKAAEAPMSVPALSDEYRAESANVLKAVLASAPKSADAETMGTVRHTRTDRANPTTISAAEMAHITPSHPHSGNMADLHSSLTSFSRAQQEMQAFSLTPSQYASITGLDAHSDVEPHHFLSLDLIDPSSSAATPSSFPAPLDQTHHAHGASSSQQQPPKHQTALQLAYASMKQNKDQVDRTLMPAAWDRSAVVQAAGITGLWEQVTGPVSEKVVRDFKKMVENVNSVNSGVVKLEGNNH